MTWNGREVAVIGLGLSNAALIRYLVSRGARVTGCDRQGPGSLGARFEELKALGIGFQLGERYLDGLDRFDTLFVTPGMRKDLPELVAAREKGIEMSSEMQLFFSRCRARTIGITGSSGKTTTTTLIGEILAAAGYDVVVGGNIGRPLIEQVDQLHEEQWVVVELSSFQLETMRYSPDIAVVTNIAPNHLDVHGTMTAYVDAKRRIYQNQAPNDWLVLNHGDGWADEMELEAPGNVRRFSRRGPVVQGAFVDGERIVLARSAQRRRTLEQVCSVRDIRLLGEHNIDNVLAAVTVADLCGVRLSTVRDVVASFTGVPHRLELVREAMGVKYYNDSIATTPERAAAGIRAFSQPIILIAGGYDKGLGFEELAAAVCQHRVKAVITVGETAERIETAIMEYGQGHQPRIERAGDFDSAVRRAHALASAGDVVLLSPGCASYGMFRNFEERGERFQQLVHDLTEETVAAPPQTAD